MIGQPQLSTRPSVREALQAIWDRRLVRGFGRWSGLTLLFALATIVQTWPLARHADDSITTWWFFPFDAWQFLWNLWWVKHALIALQNPFHTDLLLYPQGSDLYLHPLTFVNGVLSTPLQLLTGNLVLSWNLVALFSFVLSGVGAYALVHRVTGNHWAGILSGYIFAFTPFTMVQIGGHWNISTTWAIPFFMLFLLRFRESGRPRDAAFTGVFWAVLTLNWLEFATDAALFLALFLGYWSVVYLRGGDRQSLLSLVRGAGVLIVVWFVISSPVLIPTVLDLRSGNYFLPGDEDRFGLDLLAFVTPSDLWGAGTTPVIGGPNPDHAAAIGTQEGTAYLGVLPLLLAGAALFAARRRPHHVWPWVIIFLSFTILALGPNLYVNETKDLSLFGVSFTVPLPFQIYDKIPLLGVRRIPARMIVFGIMAFAVLSGVALDYLMGWVRPRIRLLAPVIAVVALGIVVLEYWNPPVYIHPLATPAVLKEISREPGDFTVLDAPLGRRTGWTFAGDATGAALANYYQTIHEKASFGGYLSRVDGEGFNWFLQQPGLHYLSCPSCPDPASPDDLDREKVREVFQKYRIKYVVVHSRNPDGNQIAWVGERELNIMDSYVRDVVGLEPVYSDPSLTVYRNNEIQ